MPRALAHRAVGLRRACSAALDIVEVADEPEARYRVGRRVHFALAGELDFPWLRASIGMLPADNHWQTLAKAALRDDLASMLRALTADALRNGPRRSALAAWKARNAMLYARFRQILADLRAAESPDLAMLSVAMRELRNLTVR